MNSPSSQLRVRRVSIGPQFTGNNRVSSGDTSSLRPHSHPDFPTSSTPDFQLTAGPTLVLKHIFPATDRLPSLLNGLRLAGVYFQSTADQQPARMVSFQPTAERSGIYRLSLERDRAHARVMHSGNRSYCRYPQPTGRFAAVGCKKARSRLERHPQRTGSSGPQSGGTQSAVGWKLVRSRLEKNPAYHPLLQAFAGSHRFLACFTGFVY